MSWVVWVLTGLNVGCALLSGWHSRRARRYRLMSSAVREARLRVAIDRAWDAAHEFEDDPQVALAAVCEWLEPVVTPEFPQDVWDEAHEGGGRPDWGDGRARRWLDAHRRNGR